MCAPFALTFVSVHMQSANIYSDKTYAIFHHGASFLFSMPAYYMYKEEIFDFIYQMKNVAKLRVHILSGFKFSL